MALINPATLRKPQGTAQRINQDNLQSSTNAEIINPNYDLQQQQLKQKAIDKAINDYKQIKISEGFKEVNGQLVKDTITKRGKTTITTTQTISINPQTAEATISTKQDVKKSKSKSGGGTADSFNVRSYKGGNIGQSYEITSSSGEKIIRQNIVTESGQKGYSDTRTTTEQPTQQQANAFDLGAETEPTTPKQDLYLEITEQGLNKDIYTKTFTTDKEKEKAKTEYSITPETKTFLTKSNNVVQTKQGIETQNDFIYTLRPDMNIKEQVDLVESYDKLLSSQLEKGKYDADTKDKLFYYGTYSAGKFVEGAVMGATAVLPYNIKGEAQIPIITPTYQFSKYLVTGQYITDVKADPLGTLSGFAGGVAVFEYTPVGKIAEAETGAIIKTPMKTLQASKDIINVNKFTKQDVVFSSAETLGKKALNPIEQKALFEPKLESANTIKTDYGTIEIEAKPIQKASIEIKAEAKTEPIITQEIKAEPKAQESYGRVDAYEDIFNEYGKKQKPQKQVLIYEQGQVKEVITIQDNILKKSNTVQENTLKPIFNILEPQTKSIQKDTYLFAQVQPQTYAIERTPMLETQPIVTTKTTYELLPQSITDSITTIEQITDTVLDLKVDTKQEITPRTIQQPIQELKTEFKLKPMIQPKPTQETKRGSMFVAKAKTKGKFITLGKYATMSEAYNRGKQFVQQTASATFKVESEFGQTQKPLNIGKGFAFSKSNAGAIIQQRGTRIQSGGEKIEITQKGIQKQRSKSIFKSRGFKL